MYVKKEQVWNPATCTCQKGKYLGSNKGDSEIPCHEIIDVQAKSNQGETKTFPTNFNEKNIIYKTPNFYILLTFLLITIALLIAVSTYCYMINY